MTDLKSLARIGLYTFFGAFLAALATSTIPTDVAGWKALILPAFAAGLAAEIVYLRKVFAKALADAAAGSLGPATPTPAATTVTTTTTSPTPPAAS